MGSEYYGKMWVATCADLQNIILREKVTRVSKYEKMKNFVYPKLNLKILFSFPMKLLIVE